jgi:hypothetical protein
VQLCLSLQHATFVVPDHSSFSLHHVKGHVKCKCHICLQILFTTPEMLMLQNGRGGCCHKGGHKNLKVSKGMELSIVMTAEFHNLNTYGKNFGAL